MKKYILLLLITISFSSCQKQTASDKKAEPNSISAKNSIDYVGVYKAVLPCADCNGLETEIAINENATYWVKTRYLGKGDKVFLQKGHFTWNKKRNIIILTDKSLPNQYLVEKDKLVQLDMYGKKMSGNITDEYFLFKQRADTSTIETAEESNDVTVDLDSRIATTTTIEKVNPALGKFPLAGTKWKLVSLSKVKAAEKGKNVYYLKLNSKDGRFVALSGCNNIIGHYVMPSSKTLTFSGIVSNKMDCADVELESYFFTTLAETKSYSLDKETLTFFGNDGEMLARFVVFK